MRALQTENKRLVQRRETVEEEQVGLKVEMIGSCFLQVKEVQSVQSMYQKEREDLKRAIEEMQKKFNQLKVHSSFVTSG